MLYVRSNVNSRINLVWKWNNQNYITEIPAGSDIYLNLHARYITAPENIRFKAHIADNQKSPVQLNGKDVLEVSASKQNGHVYVYADDPEGIASRTPNC